MVLYGCGDSPKLTKNSFPNSAPTEGEKRQEPHELFSIMNL